MVSLDKHPRVIWATALGLVALAVALSALGGRMSGQAHTLFGAGIGFCFMMLIVPAIFLAPSPISFWRECLNVAVLGAIGGLCLSLFLVSGAEPVTIAKNMVLAGAALAFVWGMRDLRHRAIFAWGR